MWMWIMCASQLHLEVKLKFCNLSLSLHFVCTYVQVPTMQCCTFGTCFDVSPRLPRLVVLLSPVTRLLSVHLSGNGFRSLNVFQYQFFNFSLFPFEVDIIHEHCKCILSMHPLFFFIFYPDFVADTDHIHFLPFSSFHESLVLVLAGDWTY